MREDTCWAGCAPKAIPGCFSHLALRLIDATYNNNKMQVATKGKMLTYLSKPEISLNPLRLADRGIGVGRTAELSDDGLGAM